MSKFVYIILVTFFSLGFQPLAAKTENAASNDIFILKKIPEEINFSVKEKVYNLTRAEISDWLEERTELVYEKNYSSEMENTDLCLYKKLLICKLFSPLRKEGQLKKKSTVIFRENSVSQFVKDLSRFFNKDPENGKLKVENGKVSVFYPSQPGIKLNEEKTAVIIKKCLLEENCKGMTRLAFLEISPEISTDNVENLGITDLIGEGHSNFKGSPKNRIYNINVATKRFDGALIKPGEEFSFVKVLGEVDAEHGYLPELVIKHDKTEPEFGGGICQVSTTVFRAAIYSGLEITARRNHAYPVSYYNPQGMDATVYVPRPDLRFVNDTSGYILIQTEIKGTELIFYFYGKDEGREIEIIGPKILEKNPDGSMKTTFTQQVFNRDRNLIREDVFNSAYDSPNKYPHPGVEIVLTEKPDDWSHKEWKEYKRTHNL